ncbi:MAG: translation initiation factor IF-3 [Nitrospinae bacterium]|nr:translation initiation factor IF-3 [Nitrospinota bacterium]
MGGREISKSLRVNGQIRARQVMVVGAEGAQLGVLSLDDALNHAADAELDLVEVAPNAEPPVCKIMDFGKFKYKQSKKAHDAKKKQKIVKIKEVKVTPNTEKHDYEFKLNHAKRFLAEGSKVKMTVFFRGREITHSELGLRLLTRFTADLTEAGIIEVEPKQEGRTLSMIVAPKAEDTKKSGDADKAAAEQA